MRMWQGASGLSNYEGIVSPAYTVLIPKQQVYPNFIKYYFKNQKMINEFKRYSQGLTSDTWNIKYNLISKIKISLPLLEEQKKISNFLSLIDEKIMSLEKTCGIYKNYKKGFIQKLFSQEIKFKNNNKNYDNWENTKFEDILKEHKLKSTGLEEIYSVSVHYGLINQIEHLGRQFASKNTEKYNLVKPGDIVYTKSPTGEFPYGIIKQSKINQNVIVSPLYGVFTPKSKSLGLILDAYFESPVNVYNYLHSIVQKGAKNTMNIANETFLSKSLLLPIDKEEQEKIASLIEKFNASIKYYEKYIEYMKKYKKEILNRLFI